jgi:hypothetical protein
VIQPTWPLEFVTRRAAGLLLVGRRRVPAVSLPQSPNPVLPVGALILIDGAVPRRPLRGLGNLRRGPEKRAGALKINFNFGASGGTMVVALQDRRGGNPSAMWTGPGDAEDQLGYE